MLDVFCNKIPQSGNQVNEILSFTVKIPLSKQCHFEYWSQYSKPLGVFMRPFQLCVDTF